MVHYKGFTPEESDRIHHTFNHGSGPEVDDLLKYLKEKTGGKPLEHVPGHGYNGKLFHGTADSSVAAKGSVSSAKSLGKSSVHAAPESSTQKAEDHAHGTEREMAAWGYAQSASQTHGTRGYVVELEPNDQMQKGARHEQNHEWISPQFKVRERLDTKPGHQGTIPSENWNKYGSSSRQNLIGDANHPGMDELKHHQKAEPSPDATPSVHANQLSLFDGANSSRAGAHGYQQMKAH